MVFGAIYRQKKHRFTNDQEYGIYIPVIYEDKQGKLHYRMVDTYMVPNPCWGKVDLEKKLWYLEQANRGETSWMIYYGCDNYYYKNVINLSSDELDEAVWEMLGDLHDYRIIGDDACLDYLAEDLLESKPLWHEDNYRWHGGYAGSNYLKKTAKKDGWKTYCHAVHENAPTFTCSYCLEDLEKTCKEVLSSMSLKRGEKKPIKNTLKKIRKYRKLQQEYQAFCDSLEKGKKK